MELLQLLGGNDRTFRAKLNLPHSEGLLYRVLRFENEIQLFQGSLLRLGEQEVEHNKLNRIPNREDNVRLPTDLFQGDWPGELIEKIAGIDRQSGESHSLGTHLEGQYFDRVQSLQGSDTDGEDCAKQEDHGDRSLSGCIICFAALSICQSCFNRGSCSTYSSKLRGSDCHTDPHDCTTSHGEKEHGTTSNLRVI
jgi:hypothetical protein